MVRRRPLLGSSLSPASDLSSDRVIELSAAVTVKRRGVETRLVLPEAHYNHTCRCNPALVKAIARGRVWFEELATGRAIAARRGQARRRQPALHPASGQPGLLEPVAGRGDLAGRRPVELTATRLTELDLPLDWTEQRRLLAN
jgi:hypothetical protein